MKIKRIVIDIAIKLEPSSPPLLPLCLDASYYYTIKVKSTLFQIYDINFIR